ncbi:MAG TPA: NYN domain-containing protein [Iamia sp.]|nr:NYN domain-containing protein [Iamia sp.]
MLWVIDGNNVMGAGADGWWNDPTAAAVRLTQVIAEWVLTHDDAVTVIFDGRPEPRLAELAGGNLTIDFARRPGRDAADDRIVELVEEVYGAEPDLSVVTSDRGLVARLPPGVEVEGAGRFRTRLGLVEARGHGRGRRSGPKGRQG